MKIYLFYFCCLTCPFLSNADQYPNPLVSKEIDKTTKTLLFMSEAEDDLQQNEETGLEHCVQAFLEKGGLLRRLGDNQGGDNQFPIYEGDAVYPACSGGNFRSQTLWTLFRKYSDKIILFPPHATRYGLDPYNGKMNWHRNDGKDFSTDEYILWAGIQKPTKLGFDIFEPWMPKEEATKEELNKISEFYNQHYYGPDSSWNGKKGKRRIYFSFLKNTHAILHRLNQTNERLDNVIVVHFPIEDLVTNPLPEWNTVPYSAVAYTHLYQMLQSHLDFSSLSK